MSWFEWVGMVLLGIYLAYFWSMHEDLKKLRDEMDALKKRLQP